MIESNVGDERYMMIEVQMWDELHAEIERLTNRVTTLTAQHTSALIREQQLAGEIERLRAGLERMVAYCGKTKKLVPLSFITDLLNGTGVFAIDKRA